MPAGEDATPLVLVLVAGVVHSAAASLLVRLLLRPPNVLAHHLLLLPSAGVSTPALRWLRLPAATSASVPLLLPAAVGTCWPA